MSHVDPDGATATGADDPCAGCALGDGAGCCGGHGAMLLRSDRSVLALAGVVIALITLAVLSVPTSRHIALLVVAVPTGVAAIATSVLGWLALRRPDASTTDRAGASAVRLLPLAVAGLMATVAIALVRAVTA